MSQGASYTKTILLADDEDFLRQCLSNVLMSEGYKVIMAEDSHEAVNIYKENIDRVDLVILDIKTKNEADVSVCKDILELNPQENIMLISAKSTTSLGNFDNINFIQKPIHPSDLLNNIRKVLDSSSDLPH
jgi:DNA-binding NtrC family response regulator